MNVAGRPADGHGRARLELRCAHREPVGSKVGANGVEASLSGSVAPGELRHAQVLAIQRRAGGRDRADLRRQAARILRAQRDRQMNGLAVRHASGEPCPRRQLRGRADSNPRCGPQGRPSTAAPAPTRAPRRARAGAIRPPKGYLTLSFGRVRRRLLRGIGRLQPHGELLDLVVLDLRGQATADADRGLADLHRELARRALERDRQRAALDGQLELAAVLDRDALAQRLRLLGEAEPAGQTSPTPTSARGRSDRPPA